MKKETIIADHVQSFLPTGISKVSTENLTSLNDVAILLYVASLDKSFKVNLFGTNKTIKLGAPYYKGKHFKLKKNTPYIKIVKLLKINGWVKVANDFIKKVPEGSKEYGRMEVVVSKDNNDRTFTVSFSKYKGTVSMYTNSSPIHLLSGQNSQPVHLKEKPKDRADNLLKMYTLPVYILFKVLTHFVGDGVENMRIYISWKNKEIYLTRLQLAAYTP